MKFKEICINSPGKVILFGEHSVVFGKRAIAFSLSLRTKVHVKPSNDISLHLPDMKETYTWSIPSLCDLFDKIKRPTSSTPHNLTNENELLLKKFIESMNNTSQNLNSGLLVFLHLYTSILPSPIPVDLTVRSEIPVGAGLGSSAAYGVCLSVSILYISGLIDSLNYSTDKNLDLINQWAYTCDCILHGKPSGIDNTVCTFGGGISFKSGTIEKISSGNLKIILVNSMVSRNTKLLVEKVKQKHSKFNAIINHLFICFDEIADMAFKTLCNRVDEVTNDASILELNELIDMNHSLLNCLGVSHKSLEMIIDIAKQHDMHAKLTGAGGGGFAFILINPANNELSVEACISDLNSKGFETYVTSLGGKGVSFEEC